MMRMLFWSFIYVSLIHRVRGVWDPTLTLVSQWGHLQEPPSVTNIRCLSMHHLPEKIEFMRVLNTGQDAHLPLNKKILEDDGGGERWPYKVLEIPPSSDPVKDRQFGAFSCQVSTHEVVTRAITLKQPSLQNAEVIPRKIYLRAHVGQNVSLGMSKVMGGDESRLVWRHKGVKIQNRGTDHWSLDIFPVSAKDAGIYELFYEGKRKFGRHAIARLVVTQCPTNRYGLNCDLVCPLCLNGGICHEMSGRCLCPPGFGGDNCQYACGMNKFGPTCSWECDLTGGNDGCSRFLICLPDPYSCTCASGFFGFNCTQTCPPGRYGANCLQMCKCNNGDVCDAITGACPNGCHEGWQGETCQVPELKQVEELQLWKTKSFDKVRMKWARADETHGSISYTIEYRFAKKEGCDGKPNRSQWQQKSTTDLEMTLDNLQPYSVYEFYISANSTLGTSKSRGGTFVTDASVPEGFPRNVTVNSVDSDSAELSWAPIDCLEAEGVLEMYETELWLLPESTREYEELERDRNGAAWTFLENSRVVPVRTNISSTKIRVSSLAAYHHYAFRVRGRTSAGAGPWSGGVVLMTEYSTVPPPRVMLIEKSAHTLSVGVASMEVPPELVRRIKLRLRSVKIDATDATEVDLEANPHFVVHNYTFSKLTPFTSYFVEAKMSIDAGWGNWSSVLSVITDETYPSAPSVSLLNAGSNHLTLVMNPPTIRNGRILKYKIRVAGSRSSGVTPVIPIIPVPESGSGVLNYTVKNLVAASCYQVNVQAATSVGWGNWSESFDAWTIEGVPEAPSSLSLVAVNGTSLRVKWSSPSKAYGKVTGYELSCTPRSSLNSSIIISDLSSQSFSFDENTREFLINHLKPLTEYTLQIRATNVKFEGYYTSKIFMTGLPRPVSLECFPDSATETTIPVHVSAMDLPPEFITFYQVIVEDGDKKVFFDENHLNNYEKSLEMGLDYYVAIQVDDSQITPYGLLVYVGDDRKYSGFWNAPLSSEKLYRFRLRVVAFDGQRNYSSYSWKTPRVPTNGIEAVAQRAVASCFIYDPQCFWFPFTVVGLSICAIWLVASIIAYKYCLNKKPKQKEIPGEKEAGSSTSIAWSVAYRKGLVSHSEASTLVKDHNTLL